jgi:hypothetical protein
MMRKSPVILALLFALACPGISSANSPRIALQSNGWGSFSLTCKNVVGVQAMDIEVEYDPDRLAYPWVEINGGELKQVTNDTLGKLLISVFRPVPDAPLDLTLNFVAKTDAAGGIRHVAVSGITWLGALSALPGAASPSDIDGNSQVEEITAFMREEKSILQRFRQFKGANGLKAFTALFAQSGENGAAQEPAIAISDGETPVAIRIKLRHEAESPAFALFDAELVSMRKTDETTLVVTVLPSKGTWNAGLALSAGPEVIDYPLVVAPRVTIGGVNEQNFLAALDRYIAGQEQAQPGKNEAYLYQYIFTANYLTAAQRHP